MEILQHIYKNKFMIKKIWLWSLKNHNNNLLLNIYFSILLHPFRHALAKILNVLWSHSTSTAILNSANNSYAYKLLMMKYSDHFNIRKVACNYLISTRNNLLHNGIVGSFFLFCNYQFCNRLLQVYSEYLNFWNVRT